MREVIQKAIRRQQETGEEFCVTCGGGVGYSALRTPIDSSARFFDGAYYTVGCGQTCGLCARSEKIKKVQAAETGQM